MYMCFQLNKHEKLSKSPGTRTLCQVRYIHTKQTHKGEYRVQFPVQKECWPSADNFLYKLHLTPRGGSCSLSMHD